MSRATRAASSTTLSSDTLRFADQLTPANQQLLFHPVPPPEVSNDYVAAASSVDAVDSSPILDRLDSALPTATIGGQWIVRGSAKQAQLYIESTAGRDGRQTLQAEADRLLPGRIQIVHGLYTRNQLQGFIDAVVAKYFGLGSSPITRVGQTVRNGDTTPTAQSVIKVSVLSSEIDDQLADDLARLIPRSVLQVMAVS